MLFDYKSFTTFNFWQTLFPLHNSLFSTLYETVKIGTKYELKTAEEPELAGALSRLAQLN